MAHEIRLAGPWECHSDEQPEWQRCVLPMTPSRHHLACSAILQLRRSFHRPSGLEATSEVFIAFQATSAPQRVLVNDQTIVVLNPPLPAPDEEGSSFELPVTDALTGFNTVCFHLPANAVSDFRNVRLRIVEADA